MTDKATDKQEKDDILDADLEYLIHEEEKLQEKLKDSSHLERFAKDLMLFMSLIKDYYKGNYRDIPYKTISAGLLDAFRESTSGRPRFGPNSASNLACARSSS